MAQSKGRNSSGKTSGAKSGTAKKSSTKTANAGGTRKKTSASGNGAGSRGRQSKAYREYKLKRDIGIIIALLAAILVFVSLLGAGGVAGNAVGSFFFGLFGLNAFIFPFLFFYLFIFLLVNKADRAVILRVVGLIGLFCSVCTFLQVVIYGYSATSKITEAYTTCALDRSGGGLVGGLFVLLFGTLFGTAGVYVIDITALVVFAILLTQKPLLSLIRERGEYVYDTRDDRRAAKEQKRLMRAERNEAIRMDREREKLLRERRKQRQEEARINRAYARMVEPQTIPRQNAEEEAERDRKTVTPITAEMENDRNARRRSGSKAQSAAVRKTETEVIPENRSGFGIELKKAEGKASFRKVPEEDVRDISGDQAEVFSVSPEDIPDEIISNSASKNTLINPAAESQEEIRQEDDIIISPAAEAEQMHFTAGTEAVSSASSDSSGNEKTGTETAKATGANSAQENTGNPEQKYARRGRPSVGEAEEIKVPEQQEIVAYVEPSLDLLDGPKTGNNGDSNMYLKETAAKLKETLHTFGVEVTINHISCGPTVTRYELTPQMGVKVSKILGLQDDIKLNLAAADIRIEAPIPGKAAIGIEVPNKIKTSVNLRELMSTDAFQHHKSRLAFCVGKDIAGQPVIADIAKMPHLLIAGATGSGKSVFINTLIMSLIYKSRPDEVKFIMVDPKVVELSVYNGIPHMLIPVVTDPKKAAGALNWAVAEMTDRYQKFAELGVRDLNGYNAKLDTLPDPEDGEKPKKMFRLVVIVDELADLMMVAQNEVEDSICRLAQLARAAGIHLIIATQRPSVNVITGLIKANMPSRVALSVTSGVDSRTIIDMNGAEKLLGNGDMLFYPQGYPKPARVQGAYLSDDEIARVCKFLKGNQMPDTYSREIQNRIESHSTASVSPSGDAMDNDEYFTDAAKMIIEKDKASIGMLQRAFRIGFNRAARIMDQLYDAGVVGAEEGTKPRKILMTMEQFENYLEEN